MSGVVLARDDTGAEQVIDAISIARRRDGGLTSHALPDRSYVSDGLTVLPDAIAITAVISQSPSTPGALTGPSRVNEVLEFLAECRRVAAVVSLQEPGRPQDTDLVVERYEDVSSGQDAPQLSIQLGRVRIAQTSSVALTVTPTTASASTPAVPSDTALGGESESDGGRRSSKSLGAATLDSITGFLGGAP